MRSHVMFLGGGRNSAAAAIAAAASLDPRRFFPTAEPRVLELTVDALNAVMPAGIELRLNDERKVVAVFDQRAALEASTTPSDIVHALKAAADVFKVVGFPQQADELVVPIDAATSGCSKEGAGPDQSGIFADATPAPEPEQEYYAVIPARAIHSVIKGSLAEALARADSMVRGDARSGSHCGRPYAVVRVESIMEPDTIPTPVARTLTESDFADQHLNID